MPSLAGVLTGSVLFGLGAVFCSGAEQAWLNDELGESAAGPALLQGAQAWNIARFVGIPLAVVLAQISISFPIVVGGLVIVAVAAALAIVMPERNFHRTPAAERETWGEMRETLRWGSALVRRRPDLRRLVLISAVVGAFSEGYDRLSTAHYLRDVGVPAGQSPVVWLGGLLAIEALLGGAAGRPPRPQVGGPAVRSDGAAGRGLCRPVRNNSRVRADAQVAVAAAAASPGGVARVVEEPLFQSCLNTDLAIAIARDRDLVCLAEQRLRPDRGRARDRGRRLDGRHRRRDRAGSGAAGAGSAAASRRQPCAACRRGGCGGRRFRRRVVCAA